MCFLERANMFFYLKSQMPESLKGLEPKGGGQKSGSCEKMLLEHMPDSRFQMCGFKRNIYLIPAHTIFHWKLYT